MKPTRSLETTIPSYLTARTSKDIIRAEHQRITRTWWKSQKYRFEIFTSELVVEEAKRGDPNAAAKPLHSLRGCHG